MAQGSEVRLASDGKTMHRRACYSALTAVSRRLGLAVRFVDKALGQEAKKARLSCHLPLPSTPKSHLEVSGRKKQDANTSLSYTSL